MLCFLPIFSVLVFSLGIHGFPGISIWDKSYQCGCETGFSLGKKYAYCRTGYPAVTHCKCEKSSCSSPIINTRYVKMTGCYLNGPKGSLVGGASDQDCSTYDYDQTKKGYVCHNDGGSSYTCPGSPITLDPKAMVCNHCKI
ncbi:uncharacterized protein MELLADRAFT_124132 [Melampsora larici-populina 98AG31]|uniref:Secreted protein n=1 Tax=Melampsora larici-populina (strain 98AG31 / pathotype 3-4-7) TaxID=747676 RepID=F4RNP9_MELLP|nr:uncharacterized protein MELLADRAFT_124132 [Melampsora larici-populina 98AG31]EGG06024.1 secreted protein [Melampsora larici-populina 98AG31]